MKSLFKSQSSHNDRNAEQFYWKRHLHKLYDWVQPSHSDALQLRFSHKEKIREIEKWLTIYQVELERIKEAEDFLEM